MPSSFLLHLAPTRAQRFDVDLGRHVHGLLFEMLAAADASLAVEVHDRWEKKPFTVSTVLDRSGRAVQNLAPEQDCLIRVTLLDDAISEIVDEHILRGGLQKVQIGKVRALVRGVYMSGVTSSADGPSAALVGRLCRRESYDEIVARPAVDRFRFLFRSPTAFRRVGRNLPLPDADILFTGLLHRWNAFAAQTMDADALASALQRGAIALSYHRIQTEVFRLPDASQIGFVGDVEFRFLEPEIRPMVSALARFAFYAGVGYKTAQGMGQVSAV